MFFNVILTLFVFASTIFIIYSSREARVKKTAIAFFLFKVTALFFLLPSIFLGVDFLILFWLTVALGVLAFLFYLVKRELIALNYSIFILILILFGGNPALINWLLFAYLIFLYVREKWALSKSKIS